VRGPQPLGTGGHQFVPCSDPRPHPERDRARPVGELGPHRYQLPAICQVPAVHAIELDDPLAEAGLADWSVPPMASLMTFLAATTDSVVWSFSGMTKAPPKASVPTAAVAAPDAVRERDVRILSLSPARAAVAPGSGAQNGTAPAAVTQVRKLVHVIGPNQGVRTIDARFKEIYTISRCD